MKLKPLIMTFAGIAIAIAMLPGTAFAQAGVTVKELTTADAAAELLQPLPAGSTSTEISNLIVPAPAPAPAPTIVPYAAEAGPLTVFNCSGAGIKVKTYNSNDMMLWVAYQEISIANGATSGLKCATSTCKLKVNSGGVTAAISGYQVYISGAVKATNQAAVTKGCAAYAPPPA